MACRKLNIVVTIPSVALPRNRAAFPAFLITRALVVVRRGISARHASKSIMKFRSFRVFRQ